MVHRVKSAVAGHICTLLYSLPRLVVQIVFSLFGSLSLCFLLFASFSSFSSFEVCERHVFAYCESKSVTQDNSPDLLSF